MSTATSTPKKSTETHSTAPKQRSARAQVAIKPAHTSSPKDVRARTESPYIAEIKGLASLQDATYSVDLEKTVGDMAAIINNMESQLDRVLSINAVLEDDLNTSKQLITELREEKARLAEEIIRLETELPTKREMEMEMEQLVEERSSVQNRIHSYNKELTTMSDTVAELRKQLVQIEMEKNDALAEVNFLESRQGTARQASTNQQNKINQLKAEKVKYQKKIISLQDECQRTMEERYALLRELQEAQDILSEVSRQ